MCSMFRNEGAGLSSELIREAISATRFVWGEPPAGGMLTFVDAKKVRHKRDVGRCFLRAGFVNDGNTSRGLVALVIRPEDMPEAIPFEGSQSTLFQTRSWETEDATGTD
jgi:hypothetical protein